MTTSALPPASLRERKKQQTRAAIQQHAFRLFRAQGYAATTIEQIAEAANVSPRTVYRYFDTKEDVVVQDAYDGAFLDAVKAQPTELSPIQAIRRTLHGFMAHLPADFLAMERDRLMLVMATPELRARMLGAYPQALRRIAEVIAHRTQRPAADYAVQLLAGGLLGVGLAAMVAAADDPSVDYFSCFDEGLCQLDAGLTPRNLFPS